MGSNPGFCPRCDGVGWLAEEPEDEDLWVPFSRSEGQTADMTGDERPKSPLVNALWGAGISTPELSPDQYRHLRWSLLAISIVTATGIGVLAAVLDSWLQGVWTAMIVLAVLLFMFAWISHGHAPRRDG